MDELITMAVSDSKTRRWHK